MPLVRPDTVHVPDGPVTVHVAPPGLAVIVNDVAGAPEPAATVTVADPSPATAVGAAGTLGTGGCGVALADAVDAAEVPPSFVAVAVNVYGVPFVRPVMLQEPEAPVTVHVAPPGLAVTVNDVAGHPVPARTDTATTVSPATVVGATGTEGGIAPDVITRLPVPFDDTATNRPLPYATDSHALSDAEVLLTQVAPLSSLVIARLPVAAP